VTCEVVNDNDHANCEHGLTFYILAGSTAEFTTAPTWKRGD